MLGFAIDRFNVFRLGGRPISRDTRQINNEGQILLSLFNMSGNPALKT